jgi:hypothetical protein
MGEHLLAAGLRHSGKARLDLVLQPLRCTACKIDRQVRCDFHKDLTRAEALTACLRCIDERGISSAPIAELDNIVRSWSQRRDNNRELSLALEALQAGIFYASSEPSNRSDGRVEAGGDQTQAVTVPIITPETAQAMAIALWNVDRADAELIRNFFRKLDGLSRGAGEDVVDRSVRTL